MNEEAIRILEEHSIECYMGIVVGPDWSEGRLSAAAQDGVWRKAAANPRGMQGYAAGR